jgi:hypothetical protein
MQVASLALMHVKLFLCSVASVVACSESPPCEVVNPEGTRFTAQYAFDLQYSPTLSVDGAVATMTFRAASTNRARLDEQRVNAFGKKLAALTGHVLRQCTDAPTARMAAACISPSQRADDLIVSRVTSGRNRPPPWRRSMRCSCRCSMRSGIASLRQGSNSSNARHGARSRGDLGGVPALSRHTPFVRV